MLKPVLVAAIVGLVFANPAFGQETSIDAQNASAPEEIERVLIADPEPGETEYFLAQGAATAEVVTEEELEMEAGALAALAEDMEGDMAAMPEVLEE